MIRRTLLATAACLSLLPAPCRTDVGLPGPQLEIVLRLDKQQFEVAEPIPVTLEIINRGTTEYAVLTSTDPTGELDGITLSLADSDGHAIARPPVLRRADAWIGSWLVLRPHEKTERKLFLNYWCSPLPPGRFAVQATYIPRTTGDWPGIQSAPVEFDIQPTTAIKLEVRLARLSDQAERGDPLAIDFLGFTGETAAIGPLLDALYNDETRLQRRAAIALSLIHDRGATLKAVLDKAQELGPTAMAAEWLAVVRAPAAVVVPVYLRAMNSQDADARLGGMTGLRLTLDAALADKKHATAVRWAIRNGLRDRDARVRYEAVLAAQLYSDPQIRSGLKSVAENDPVRRVRAAAAATLAQTQ